MRGLIMIERDILRHPVLKPKEFSRVEAWLWMISEARWKEGHEDIGGKTVLLKRGQFSHSIRFIQSAWGWTKGKTERFIARLRSETMIETDTGTGRLIITICNYNKYQDFKSYRETQSETENRTVAGQQRDSSGTVAGQTITPEATPDVTPDVTQGYFSGSAAPSKAQTFGPTVFPIEAFGVESVHAKESPTLDLAAEQTDPPKSKTSQVDEVRQAVDLFNDCMDRIGGSKCQAIDSRRSAIQARLKDAGGIEGWKIALQKIEQSNWLSGRKNGSDGTPFKMRIDYFTRPKPFASIMEGAHDDSPSRPAPSGGNASISEATRMAKEILRQEEATKNKNHQTEGYGHE